MNWSECCGCAMAFYAAYQRHMMVQNCCGSGSTNEKVCDQELNPEEHLSVQEQKQKK